MRVCAEDAPMRVIGAGVARSNPFLPFPSNPGEIMKSKLIKLTAMLSLLVAGGVALAQDIQERTIRFGHLNNTDHPTSFGVKKFAEIVAAKSGGKITVKE